MEGIASLARIHDAAMTYATAARVAGACRRKTRVFASEAAVLRGPFGVERNRFRPFLRDRSRAGNRFSPFPQLAPWYGTVSANEALTN